MRPIPPKLRAQIVADPFMLRCIHTGCTEKPEWEHAFIYAGKQVNEAWAIVPVCVYHHRGAGLDKQFNQFVALNRASKDDLAKYPRTDWEQLLTHLTQKYGVRRNTEKSQERTGR